MNNIQKIFNSDIFANKLGIELIIENEKWFLKMTITKSMINGLGYASNSVLFSFAETASNLLANSFGTLSIPIKSEITYPLPVKVNDTITTDLEIIEQSEKSFTIEAIIRNQNKKVVGIYLSNFFRSSKEV